MTRKWKKVCQWAITGIILALPLGLCASEVNEPLPPSVRRVLHQAHTLIEARQTDKARLKLEAYLEKRKQPHYLVPFTLGNLWMAQAAYPQAARAYRQSTAQRPDFAPAWMNLGKAVYEMANYNVAADCFYKAYQAEAEPRAETLYYSATAYLLANDPDKGLETFQLLLKMHAPDVKLDWKPVLVQLYQALDQPVAALPVIEELAARSVPHQKAQWQETLLGHYLLLGQTNRALAYARDLTRLDPTTARWWRALAHLLLEQAQYEKALQALMIYAKINVPDAAEKKLLADLSLQVGIPVVAAQYYRELTAADPDTGNLTGLVQALRQMDQQAEALEQIDHHQPNPIDPDLLWLKGELLFEMKQYEAAAKAYRSCARDGSQAGHAWLMAGYASFQAGDLVNARDEFTRAEHHPEQKKHARAALRELENFTAADGI